LVRIAVKDSHSASATHGGSDDSQRRRAASSVARRSAPSAATRGSTLWAHWNLQGADDAATYAICDDNLNGPGQILHGTLGQPIQGPLNAERVTVLDEAVARAKAAAEPPKP